MNNHRSIFMLIYFLNLLFLILISQRDALSLDPREISGRFINYSFLEQLPDKIPGSIPNYCLEINFISPDSAEVFNGFEEFRLAYRMDGENFVFLNAVQGKDLHFKLKDEYILLEDSIWTGIPPGSMFKKIIDDNFSKEHKWVFEKYLNERMIAGDYTVNEKKEAAGSDVKFTAEGKVTGLKDFTEYSICYSGDYTGETDPVSNTISFKRNTGEEIMYAFKFDKNNNSISFYNISDPVPDIKGERQILDMSFELENKISK